MEINELTLDQPISFYLRGELVTGVAVGFTTLSSMFGQLDVVDIVVDGETWSVNVDNVRPARPQ